jgi:hypothetical protein
VTLPHVGHLVALTDQVPSLSYSNWLLFGQWMLDLNQKSWKSVAQCGHFTSSYLTSAAAAPPQ